MTARPRPRPPYRLGYYDSGDVGRFGRKARSTNMERAELVANTLSALVDQAIEFPEVVMADESVRPKRSRLFRLTPITQHLPIAANTLTVVVDSAIVNRFPKSGDNANESLLKISQANDGTAHLESIGVPSGQFDYDTFSASTRPSYLRDPRALEQLNILSGYVASDAVSRLLT